MILSDVSSERNGLSKWTYFSKGAALKDAANGAAIKLGYAMGMKKEQLEVVLAFLSGNDVFAVLPSLA